jgi:O-antigen/teichoic acid export membrane protein
LLKDNSPVSIAPSAAPRRKRILGALLLGFVAEIINKISPLITLSIAQKRLGLGGLGSALFSLSILEVCIPFIVFGYTYFGAMQLPKIVHDKEAQAQLVSRIVVLRLIHACLASVGLLLATIWIDSWQEHRLILWKLIPFLFVAAFDLTLFNFGNQRMGRLSLWVGLFKLVSLAGVLALVRGPEDGDIFAMLMLGANGAVSVASAISILPHLGLRKVEWRACSNLFKLASGYALVVFLYPMFERFDILVVEKTLSPEHLGSYTAPWRLVMSLVPLFMVIAHTFLAENLAEKNQEGVAKGAHQALFLSLMLTVPVVVASPFVAGDILSLVFDESLRASDSLFTIFSASILAEVFVCILGMQILLLRGDLRYLAMTLAVGIGLGSGFAWMIQEAQGATGSAWAAFAGRCVTVLLIAWRIVPVLRALPWRDYLAIPISAGIMGLALWCMPNEWPLFLRILLGGLTDLLVLTLLQREKLVLFLKTLRHKSPQP